MGKTLGYGEITVANMTEPFTVMLTNEAQQFATDSNRKVTSAQSYYTDIIVIRGSQERTDYTIGNITSGSGITVSKSSKRVTFSVSAGTTIGADTGVIEIPITLDGQTVKKQFSWSCGKQGPQGVKGEDGSNFAWNLLKGTGTAKEFTPKGNLTNQTTLFNKLDLSGQTLKEGDKFVISCDLEWTQFTQGTSGTFDYWFQGSVDYSWSYDNIFTQGLQKVQPTKAEILASDGKKHLSAVCTMKQSLLDKKIFEIGIRFDNTDGTGKIKISNLKIAKEDKESPWCLHPDELKGATGDKGKSVQSVIEYYLATSASTGVTTSTSGWSTDPTTQKLTAEKKYLWNCKQTVYDDGTRGSITSPVICGTYGDKGQNAKNLSITPSSQYFKSTDGGKTFAPNTITIKPTIQGEISFGKWQYSIDGGVSFADVVSGQKGLTVSNNVLAVSKDSSLYSDAVTMVTFRAVANDSSFYDTCSIAKIYDVSDIGDGRNLIQKSQLAPIDSTDLNLDDYSKNGTVVFINKSVNSGFSFDKYNNYQSNSKYVLSYYFTKTSGTINSFGGFHNGKRVVYTSFFVDDKVYDTASYAGGSSQIGTILNDGKRHRIVVCYTTPDTIATDTSVNYTFIQPGRGNTNPNFGVKIEELKLEKGSSPTGWSAAPEDLQTAILSTKSEISDVSLKVDKNKQAIEQRVEKTTYQQDLNLVKGDINKANEGLNKWRYEIYPKSLFASEYQGKSTMDVFAKNTNLTPTQSVLINDTDLSIQWNYAENYIGYALTFTKFSAAKSVAITFAHDDGAHIYLNGKLIGGSDAYNRNGESLTLGFVKGWNCIEVVVNEGASTEGFTLGTTISALSECQLMNCYYGTPVARQSHITNQLVENTTNINGISTKVSKVTSVIGDNGENFTSFKKDYSDFKQTMNGFKTTVGQTYVTKDDFNGLEIGGRNLLLYSQTIRAHNNYYGVSYLIDEVETFNGCPVWSVKDQWGKLAWSFKSHVIDRGLVKVGDTLTYSLYAKTNNASGKSISCSYRFKGNAQSYWFKGSAFNIGTSWARYSATFTVTKDMLATDTYMNEIGFEETVSMSGDDKVYFACPKLERGTKATDYTEAPEDDKINGQNLVSNLPSNWEQGTVSESSAVGTTYANTKSSNADTIRPKELIPVHGDITISAAYSNQSKKPIRHWIAAYDINKNYLGQDYVLCAWNDFPQTLNMKDAKYIAIMVGYADGSPIAPSDISQICLKIERGTSATPFTLAPEDVNGKIVNAETIANQTANKFSWIVKSGTSASNFEITDKFMNLVSTNINLDGIVSFMNTAKGDGRKNLYNLDYSSFENVASQEDAICYAKDNGVTSVGIDSSVSYDGDKSLKISYTTANLNSSTTPLYLGSSTNNYGCVKIQAGKQYILSCYVKSDSTTGMFMIDIQGHDTPDTKTNGLYLSNIDPRKLPGSSTGVNLSTDWQRAVCAIKVADNATGLYWSVVPLIWGKPSSSNVPQTFNVWVDCIMLEEVDSISNEPGTYILDKETIIDGGSVKADTITGNQILAGSITADKIATDAIKSHNYISSGGTQGSFLNLGDGSFTSPNLSWDSNGNLIAKNANLSGEITATKGKIGKYTITDQWLITGSGSTASGFGGNQAFWAGSSSSNDAPFRVGYNGKLYANGATISGDITATTGKIGDLTLKDGILTGTGSYSEPYTEDDDGTVTSTITTNYITKLFGKGLTIDSTVKYSDEDDVYSYKVSVLPDEISFTDGEEIGMLGAGGLQILQVNDNSDSYSSEANEVSLSSGASNFYYTTPVNQTTDKYLHVCFSADGASFMASQGDKFNSFDIGYSSAKYSGNFAANKFVYTGNSLNYVECLEANDTTNIYFHSNGYYSFRVNNEGNWSNETQSVYITERGISVPGQIGLYSQEMSNYVARYYIAGSTKSTAIGNNSYQTRIYGSSVWANKAVSTSDVRLKQDFQSLDKFEDLYMQLQPVSFKYIDGYDKSEDRYFGLKAQPTEKLFEDMGENPDDYAMFNKFGIDHEDIKERIGYDVDFDEEHGLDYTNLITLNTHMVQKTRRELAELQKENAELKDMLKTIVKKINM